MPKNPLTKMRQQMDILLHKNLDLYIHNPLTIPTHLSNLQGYSSTQQGV